jgi:hypothetical protein
LRIEIPETTDDMTDYVFVYRQHPADPYTGEIFEEFCTVASPVDLSEYPVGAPDPNKPFPFFRKNFIEVDLRSQADFDGTWELIQTEVCRLVAALDLMDNLVTEEEVICGTLPASSESVSASISMFM